MSTAMTFDPTGDFLGASWPFSRATRESSAWSFRGWHGGRHGEILRPLRGGSPEGASS